MNLDKAVVFVSTIFLTFFGLLLNASVITTQRKYFFKEVLLVSLGIVVFVLVLRFFEFDILKKRWIYIVGGIILFLLLTYLLIFGKPMNNARRWLYIGPISIQVSEIVKLYVISLIAYSIYKYPRDTLMQCIVYAFILVLSVLILFEPDLGMSFFIVFISTVLFVVANMYDRKKVVIVISFVAIISVLLVFFYFLPDKLAKRFRFTKMAKARVVSMVSYQKRRVIRFTRKFFPYKIDFDFSHFSLKLLPRTYEREIAYSMQSSKVKEAIENATWFGAGLSQGSLTKYLPERQNDYISVLALEETGILGVCILGFLFLIMFISILRIGLNSDSVFVQYLVTGIGFVIFVQALLHFGVNFQVLPEKGISLPFVSYGGTSYLINITMIAMVLKARV